MKGKKRVILFFAKLASWLPWTILDFLNPKNKRMIALKNEIIIEKFLRSGRARAGKKGILELKKLKYDNDRINFNVISTVVSFCAWCDLNGYIPSITVKQSGTEIMLWSMLFKPIVSNGIDLKETQKQTLQITGTGIVFDKRLLDFWRKAFAKWVIPNDITRDYCNNEYEKILKGKRCLGVLARGTDYTTLKPKGHGVQPTVEQLIEEVEIKMHDLKCDYIYLATEEKRIYNIFNKKFPGKVIINKRVWYDDYYNGYKLIGEMSHNRKNDEYFSALEYYSSVNLLSKCVALIAGNCGGSMGAALMNGGEYEYMYIFNLGRYK